MAALVVGQWGPMGANDPLTFMPAKYQPQGKAQREIAALTSWLRQPETIKALIEEGLTKVRVIRNELIEAEFSETRVMKAKVG